MLLMKSSLSYYHVIKRMDAFLHNNEPLVHFYKFSTWEPLECGIRKTLTQYNKRQALLYSV